MTWTTSPNPGAIPVPGGYRNEVLAALAHYDECRRLCDDALRVAGLDSGEYVRAEQAKRIALLLLDSALGSASAREGGV